MNAESRLVFRAGDRRYALPVNRVRELARLPRMTPVPLAPPALIGLGNMRGETLAILSPAALEGQVQPRDARQMLVLAGADRVAIAIDSVETGTDLGDVAELPLDDLIAQGFPVRESARRSGSGVAQEASRAPDEDHITLLRFGVGDQSLALPVEEVAEILRVPDDIARLPHGEAAVVGMIAWNDLTIGVLSLAALLGLAGGASPNAPDSSRRQQRIIVVALGSHRLGLLVDRVETLLQVPASRIDSVPASVLRGDAEARIRAICRAEGGGRLISILAADQLLSEARTRHLLASATVEKVTRPAPSASVDRSSLLPVRIGRHRLAFPVAAIDRVAATPSRLTPVPGCPAWLLGIAAVAGEPLPVIDQVLRLTGSPASGTHQRLVLVRASGQRVGFLVDEARAMLAAESSALFRAPLPASLAAGIFGEVLQHGAADDGDPLLVLDPAALISSAEQALLAGLTEAA